MEACATETDLHSCMYVTPYHSDATGHLMQHCNNAHPSRQGHFQSGYTQSGYGCCCPPQTNVQNYHSTGNMRTGCKEVDHTRNNVPNGYFAPYPSGSDSANFYKRNNKYNGNFMNSPNSSQEHVHASYITQPVLQQPQILRSPRNRNTSVNRIQASIHNNTPKAVGTNNTGKSSKVTAKSGIVPLNEQTLDHGEDVEEEDISDDEEAEQSYKAYMESRCAVEGNIVEDALVTGLLGFAELASCDINKYFGKKEGQCNIYEDKWVCGKSGRELYYSDLLKIAQGDGYEDGRSKDKRGNKKNHKKSPTTKIKGDQLNQGRIDLTKGLGPLEDLFHDGVKVVEMDTDKAVKNCDSVGSATHCTVTRLSMNKRKLPESFWKQPNDQIERKTYEKRRCVDAQQSPQNMSK